MSYNITRWKTKKIDNLRIRKPILYTLSGDLIRLAPLPDDLVVLTFLDSEIKAKVIEDNTMLVKGMNISGDGSGFFFHEVLKPALSKSTGTLIAVLIWEGGDSISQIEVTEGKIIEKQVDL